MKLGIEGAQAALRAGANDLGGRPQLEETDEQSADRQTEEEEFHGGGEFGMTRG